MSQGSTVLPTTGVFSGLTEQGNINAALAALLSLNSGGSAPASPTALQLWADTSVSGFVTLRQWTGSTWQPIWTLDLATDELSFAAYGPQNWVAASGTHDAITAAYDPPATALTDGMMAAFRATSANLTTTPTFNRDGLGAGTITKNGGAALAIGDIPGNLAEVQLRYNLANTRWELLSPPAVPVGGIVPYFGGTLPSGYALPQGQNLSATSFPAANAVLGTTYGNPGGGNFTMPDLRGRFFFNLDAGGSNRLSSVLASTTLGATGGSQGQTLSASNIPSLSTSYTPQGSIGGSYSFSSWNTAGLGLSGGGASGQINTFTVPGSSFNFAGTPATITVGSGSPSAVDTVPPAMGVNCMMRIA